MSPRPNIALTPDEQAVYDFCTELHRNRSVSDATYARALGLLGVPGVVELTALFGYYSMVAMTILAHQMPVQDGAAYRLAPRAAL